MQSGLQSAAMPTQKQHFFENSFAQSPLWSFFPMALWSGIRADDNTVREVHRINKLALLAVSQSFRIPFGVDLEWNSDGCPDAGLHRGKWPWLGLFLTEKLRRDVIKIPHPCKARKVGTP